jgi:hypothetical protein
MIDECVERLHLVDIYSQEVTHFNTILESLKRAGPVHAEGVWKGAELARVRSQQA